MGPYDRQTALLVIDVQNDFADPGGSLYVAGAEEILPVVDREIARALGAGALVVYTQDWHPPVTPHFRKDGGVWPVHCVRNSWGAQLHPAVRRIKGATAILTGRGSEDGYSGFGYRDPLTGRAGKTALEDVLRKHGIRRVVVVGLATDYCVKETARDARERGFETGVLQDGVRAVDLNAGDGVRALKELARRGVEIATSGQAPPAPVDARVQPTG